MVLDGGVLLRMADYAAADQPLRRRAIKMITEKAGRL
jgi:hypothetical protein